jgi:peroxiredoxin
MKGTKILILMAAMGLWACDKETEAVAEPAEAVQEVAQAAEEKVEEAGAAVADAAKEEAMTVATVGKRAPEFELKDESGKTHKLSDYKGKIVVLEWTNPDCPYVVRHYEAKTMQKTWEKFGPEKVVWLAVDSSNFVKPESSTEWKGKEGFGYPVLQDPSGTVGKLYEAKTTPHMYIVDAEGVLRYNGAIDDDPRGKSEAPTNHVEQALGALLEGKDVPQTNTKPYGCSVKYSS